MSVRQSKRLKVTAERRSRSSPLLPATATAQRLYCSSRQGSRHQARVRRPAKARGVKPEYVVAQAAAVESPSSSVAAVVANKSVEETKNGGASAAKDAWGALFAKKRAASKAARSGRVSPKPATPVTTETLAKIDSYASFDGLTPHAGATKLKIAEDADVVCLSETKIDRDELHKFENLWPQYKLQYWSCATKKGYSGTAIFSKTKPLSVKDKIVVPNAGQKLERLAGFVDTFRQLHPEEQLVSYFSYRFNARAKNKGWRLDYFVVSQTLLSKVVRAFMSFAGITHERSCSHVFVWMAAQEASASHGQSGRGPKKSVIGVLFIINSLTYPKECNY